MHQSSPWQCQGSGVGEGEGHLAFSPVGDFSGRAGGAARLESLPLHFRMPSAPRRARCSIAKSPCLRGAHSCPDLLRCRLPDRMPFAQPQFLLPSLPASASPAKSAPFARAGAPAGCRAPRPTSSFVGPPPISPPPRFLHQGRQESRAPESLPKETVATAPETRRDSPLGGKWLVSIVPASRTCHSPVPTRAPAPSCCHRAIPRQGRGSRR